MGLNLVIGGSCRKLEIVFSGVVYMGDGKENGVGGKHQVLKEKAKNRVDNLQRLFYDLQLARKESRTNDVILLEEQVNQILLEWQTELNQPSPASSFQVLF